MAKQETKKPDVSVENVFKAFTELADAAIAYSEAAGEENARELRECATNYAYLVKLLENA